MTAGMDRLEILTARFGARNTAVGTAVTQHEATRAVLICHDRGLPCAAWAAYRPNRRFVVNHTYQRVELRAKQ